MRKKLYEVLTEYIEIKYTKIYAYLAQIVVSTISIRLYRPHDLSHSLETEAH
jgi:hypothetical protein